MTIQFSIYWMSFRSIIVFRAILLFSSNLSRSLRSRPNFFYFTIKELHNIEILSTQALNHPQKKSSLTGRSLLRGLTRSWTTISNCYLPSWIGNGLSSLYQFQDDVIKHSQFLNICYHFFLLLNDIDPTIFVCGCRKIRSPGKLIKTYVYLAFYLVSWCFIIFIHHPLPR